MVPLDPTTPPTVPALLPPQGAPVAPPAPSFPPLQDNLPWTATDRSQWNSRISASKDTVLQLTTQGRQNLRAYRNNIENSLKGGTGDDELRIPSAFWNTEQKRSQLFYQVPTIRLKPKTEAAKLVAPTFTQILQDYLGPEHINVAKPMATAVFDVICPMAYGVMKVGYQPITMPVPTGAQDAEGADIMRDHPVDDDYYVKHISPGCLLYPSDFIEFDFDDADWVGFRFWEDVPQGEKGGQSDSKGYYDCLLVDTPSAGQRSYQNRREGVEIWYKAYKLDPTVTDPKLERMFVWMNGDDAPREHRDSPYQYRSPIDGSIRGMKGHAVKVLKIRPMSDTAVPPSDVAMTRKIADERSRGRTQALQHRDRSLPVFGYNALTVTEPTLAKLEQGIIDGLIGMNGPQQQDIWQIAQGHLTNDSYRFDDVCERDEQKAWAFGNNQLGIDNGGQRTATELSIAENNSQVRMAYEQAWVLWFFASKIVEPVAMLLQQFADRTSFVGIVDQNGDTQFRQWNKQDIQGEFAFEVLAGSQLRKDQATEAKKAMDWVNFSAKSPYVNQIESWKAVAEAFNLDPQKMIVQPPPPKPPPPSIGISFKGEDLNPLAPQYTNVVLILTGGDLSQLQAPSALIGQQMTDGSAPKADLIDKHQSDETGLAPGGAAMIPHAKPIVVN